MGTLGILYLVFGIMYLLACIADGQDVKPLWKRWLGGKLERYADRLKPIDYCNMRKCSYYMEAMEARQRPPSAVLMKSRVRIDESELFRAMTSEYEAKRRGYAHLLPSWETKDGLVENAKRTCVKEILKSVERSIVFEVHEGTSCPEIFVEGILNIEKKIIY